MTFLSPHLRYVTADWCRSLKTKKRDKGPLNIILGLFKLFFLYTFSDFYFILKWPLKRGSKPLTSKARSQALEVPHSRNHRGESSWNQNTKRRAARKLLPLGWFHSQNMALVTLLWCWSSVYISFFGGIVRFCRCKLLFIPVFPISDIVKEDLALHSAAII